jgi:hypothetical protein
MMYHCTNYEAIDKMLDTVRPDGPIPAIDWVERSAVGASLACLLHCLALPLVLAALPILSGVLAIPETFHSWVLAFAVPASGLALAMGRVRHGTVYPLVLGAVGLLLLAVGALMFGGTALETPVTVVGSLALAGAHVANWRLRHGHNVGRDWTSTGRLTQIGNPRHAGRRAAPPQRRRKRPAPATRQRHRLQQCRIQGVGPAGQGWDASKRCHYAPAAICRRSVPRVTICAPIYLDQPKMP